MKIFDRVKKWGKRLALTTVLFHGATQLNCWRNDISNALNPSPLRKEFYDQFGIPVRGWASDIEDNPEQFKYVVETLCREKQTGEFNLKYLRVESQNYLKRDLREQIGDIFTIGYEGWCFKDRVGISRRAGESTISHEIKHAKTDEVIKKHPEFLQRWEEFARDENGNSLYRGNAVTNLRRLRGLERLFRDSQNCREDRKLGFISSYARSNVYEDIAETCETAELTPEELTTALFGNEFDNSKQKNEKIVGKLKLAEKYGLIPKGFFEYAELRKEFPKALGATENILGSKLPEDVVLRAEDFIKKYPNSVYECELRRYIGNLLESRAVVEACLKNENLRSIHNLRRNWIHGTIEEAEKVQERENELLRQNKNHLVDHLKLSVREYERALQSRFKEKYNYLATLCSLEKCYEILGDDNRAKIFHDAIDEYHRRFNNSDLKLPYQGINNYLELRGISLDPYEKRSLTNISGGWR